MVLVVAALIATTLRGPADVETLAREADAVVHARVAARSSAWGAGGGQIFTKVVLRPVETWKGVAAHEVAVVVAGGVVGEWDQIVDGAPRFGDGEEVVVFLRARAPGAYEVLRMALGKFAVARPAPGATLRAVRDRSGVACVGCAPGEPDELSLDELRVRVLRSLGR